MALIDNKQNDDKATISRQSIIEAPLVSAFGDDDEDYKRITEQKDTSENDNQKSDKNDYGTKFGITTFSKAPKGLEDMKAIYELENRSSTIQPEDGQDNVDTDSSENTSEHSADLSDDKGSSSESHGSWHSFTLNKFQVKSSNGYCCAPLQHPLLPKKHKSDHLASLASWVTILRIMGDLPEVDFAESLRIVAYTKPIVLMVKENFSRKYTKKDIEDAYRCYTELFKDPSVSETKNVPFLPKNKASMLEKVQFITALGILKADLRDELYCQACKQMTNNPSRNSFTRGWVVLFMLAGSFLPSEKFAPVMLQILKDGPADHAPRVERLLRRTFTVGTRGQPPSWLEFQAAKNSKPVLVPIILMNGTRLLVDVDSATTANELCFQISHRIGLTERNGFSIYITLGQMIACLGHGSCRIMDAISECEQNTRGQGMRESSSMWRLFFRKEFFAPWYDPQNDTCATELIYQQIMRGVSIGEYKCEKEAVLVLMAAQKYYIDFTADTDETTIENFLSKFLPKEQMNSHDMAYWVEKIKQEIENDFLTDKPNPMSLKADIVTFAMNKWHNLFSRFYEASNIYGPHGTWNNVVIGINCKGFNFIDEHENVRVHLTFIEITKMGKDKNSVIISTLQGDEYIAITMHTEDLFSMLTTFQLGLRERSRYAIAVRDIPQSGIQKGDLVKLDKSFGEFKDTEAYTGISLKNKKQGSIPRDVLFILPTMEEPPSHVMGMLVMQLRKDLFEITSTMTPVRGPENYTLQNYSKIRFRQPSDSTVTKLFSMTAKKDKDTLWQFSKEPLKKPLLRRTSMRDELCKAACRSFLAIQIYMGDATNKDNISETQLLNDDVIDVAIRNKYLQEEIFCQVIKQLTQNPNKLSEERGWQLLYLLLSCTYPQTDLSDELENFLKTSQHSYAKKCLAKMHTTKREGRRYTPPHELEHSALKNRNANIEYTVLFPDQSIQKIEVDSSTRMFHLLNTISKMLQLQNADEYGLFFGLRDKVISVIQWDYFFDNLSLIQRYFMKQQKDTVSNEASSPPALIFMKKLWMNANPGQDKLADLKFHFPQEVPNYLRGYHKCSIEDSIQLGSLLFLAKYGNEKQPLENIASALPSLIPETMISQKKPADWRQALQASISKLKFSSKEDAKVAFLKSLHKWETYGSVFFEVKQRSSKQYPRNLLLAINHNGVLLLNAETRDVLVTYSFNKVPNWAFDDYTFTLVIGEGSRLTKFYMETKVGHNIDDLIMTYIAYTMSTQIKNKPTYAGIVVGESLC